MSGEMSSTSPLAGTMPVGGGETGFLSRIGEASARRKAIAQTMRGTRIKHNLIHSPTIKHPRTSGGVIPKFKAAGASGAERFVPGAESSGL